MHFVKIHLCSKILYLTDFDTACTAYMLFFIENKINFFILYINCYLTTPWPTLGHSQGDSLS